MGDLDRILAGCAVVDFDRVARDFRGRGMGRTVKLCSPERQTKPNVYLAVYKVVRRELEKRPFVTPGEVDLLMGFDSKWTTYKALSSLRRRGLLRYDEGSRKRLVLAPGAPAELQDGRSREARLRRLGSVL